MKTIVFLVIFTSLIGCSSAGQFSTNLDSVPPSRVYGFTKKSDAQLIVLHDSTNVTCTISLSIDGKHAAELEPGEIVHFWVTFGTHKLAALPLDGCTNSRMQAEKINVKAGDAVLRHIEDLQILAVTR